MNSMKPAEWAMLALLSFFWGGSFFFVKVALHDLQPFTIVWLRVSLGRASSCSAVAKLRKG